MISRRAFPERIAQFGSRVRSSNGAICASDLADVHRAVELDQDTPLEGQRELLACTPSEKRVFVRRGADRGHFGDRIEEPGGCPPEPTHAFTRGPALAHVDAALEVDEAAKALLAGNVSAALRSDRLDADEGRIWRAEHGRRRHVARDVRSLSRRARPG